MKISPLRASLEAFNKLKTNNNTFNNNLGASNPFKLSFKSKALQLDVFEPSNSTGGLKQNTLDFFKKSWGAIDNRYANLKENAVSFMGKVQKTLSAKIDLNPFKYSVSNLQKQPVSELKNMLTAELKGV